MFELNKTYKDGYGNEMLVVYINPDPQIRYPVVAVAPQTNTIRTYTPDGIYRSPDSRSNLIPPTIDPRPGEIWFENDYPNILYHIFKSPETGTLLAVNTERFELFVLDSDDPRWSRGGSLKLDTRYK